MIKFDLQICYTERTSAVSMAALCFRHATQRAIGGAIIDVSAKDDRLSHCVVCCREDEIWDELETTRIKPFDPISLNCSICTLRGHCTLFKGGCLSGVEDDE